MKKTIALGIVFFFVLMSVTSISGFQINNLIIKPSVRGNILYVGGNGTGNYSTIQSAINSALSGDTVFVLDDSAPYNENIVIDKSINLTGENKDTTIKWGDCYISADWVNINGFTICNGSIQNWDGFSNIVISDNHFIYPEDNTSGYGIILFYVENIFINSNIFTDCDTSIRINECIKNIIISNNIFLCNNKKNLSECEIDCFEGESVTISNNTFINNYQNKYSTCIQLDFSKNYIIENNEINGYQYGISNYNGKPYYNDYNLISHNSFKNNNEGISIAGNYNKIIKNSFIKNDFGCKLFYGKDNKILNNNFIKNEKDAFSIILSNNIVDSNYWDEWIGLKIPKLSFLPYFSFSFLGSFIDRHPSKEPYNLTTSQDHD